MTFRVGDDAYYRDHAGNIETGTVVQVEGGKDGNLTEVRWHRIDQALWMETDRLWSEKPSWCLDESCYCGCTFGEHSMSGCVPHQIHKFTPDSAVGAST